MDLDIKLFRESSNKAGEHSRWTAIGLTEFVEIEAAAAFDIRKNGYFTSRAGRRLIKFLSLTAGLSEGLSAKRMREIWRFGIPYPDMCDQLIENKLRRLPHSKGNLYSIKAEICQCIGRGQSIQEPMFHLFIELLKYFELTRWSSKSNLIETVSNNMIDRKLSTETLGAIISIMNDFAPQKSSASGVEGIDWPYNGKDVSRSLKNATEKNITKNITSALRHIKSPVEEELVALGKISSQAEISDILTYLFWPGCSLKEAAEALLGMLESLGAEKVSNFIRLDEEYAQENRAGFPDLIAWNKDVFLFLEVKGPNDRLQESQKNYEAHVIKKLGYRISICNVSPDLSGGIPISHVDSRAEVVGKKASEVDRSIREITFPKIRGSVKPDPRTLKASMYYSAATEESQKDNIRLAVEILEYAQIFCREESIYFNIDKYVQYKYASGWRGDFASILKEDFFNNMRIPGPNNIGSFFSGLGNVYHSLGKLSGKGQAEKNVVKCTIMVACCFVIREHISALESYARKEVLDAKQIRRISLLSEDEGRTFYKDSISSLIDYHTKKIFRCLKKYGLTQSDVNLADFIETSICSSERLDALQELIRQEVCNQSSGQGWKAMSIYTFDALRDMSNELEAEVEQFISTLQ